jgi:glycosidase
MAQGRLFISYRREDSKYVTKLIYDRLTERFGKKCVFMDVVSIEGGIDYQRMVRDTVAACDVCVAIIGDKWWSASDASGARRLEDPDDLLRLEIATALRAEIAVIPCILDEAPFPAEGKLPEDLRPLAARQQVNIAHPSFDRDIPALIRAIREAFARADQQRRQARHERWRQRFVSPVSAFVRRRPVIITTLAAVFVAVCVMGVYAFGTRPLFANRALLQGRPPAISRVWLPSRGPSYPSPADWRDEVLYYVLPDRFSDGGEDRRPLLDPTNPKAARGEGWNGQAWLQSGSTRWQGGTLAGVRSKLGYLKDLGVSTLWLAPLAKQRPFSTNVESYTGFSVQDFLDVDPHLGSRRDLVDLVSDAHRHQMRVILTAMLVETGLNWQYPDSVPGGPRTPQYTSGSYPWGAWLNAEGKPVAKPTSPDDGVWPLELQDPDVYVRAGTWFSSSADRKRGDFPGLRRLRFARVLETMAACYKYWMALTDCDGIYLEGLQDVTVEDAHSFCRLIKTYAAGLGKRNLLISGGLFAEETVQSQYLARLGGDLDAVLDLGATRIVLANRGQSPAEYFKELDASQSPMAGYRYEGKRTVLMIGSVEGFAGGRFGVNAQSAHQIAAATALQLFTPGIPCLYYGDEQALGMNPNDIAGPNVGYRSVFQREAMFGPLHPRKTGSPGLARGNAGLDPALPGFGPFGTSGWQSFNTAHPAYRRIAALISTRRKYAALRTGSLEIRQIRAPGGLFRDSGAGDVTAWARSLGSESLLCVVNLNGAEQCSADVSVNSNRMPAGSELTVVANTMHAAEGKSYTGPYPVTSRLLVKGDASGSYVEIRDLSPSEVLILAGKPVEEDTDFGQVANQYRQNPYASDSSGYYPKPKRR